MRRALPLALVSIALLAAGCGGDDNGGGGGSGGGGGGGGGGSSSGETDGKQVFASTCGSCHTLDDAGTSGTFGPNLDELKPDEALVLSTIKAGPGAMPSNLLTGARADAVAAYVASAAGQ